MDNCCGAHQVDVMLHETHAGVTWPALAVVVPYDVLVVRVWVLRKVPLDEVLALVRTEAQQDVQLVNGS